jgi:hypothetical protein
MDASCLVASYANFVQVTGTPEEVILDLGLDRPAIGASGASPHKVVVPAGRALDRRIVLSFVTAKRLWRAIQLAVQRHETSFGPLETDVRRRLTKPQAESRSISR